MPAIDSSFAQSVCVEMPLILTCALTSDYIHVLDLPFSTSSSYTFPDAKVDSNVQLYDYPSPKSVIPISPFDPSTKC